jgi:PadR family transcriptional regulator, regulatory protein PadR
MSTKQTDRGAAAREFLLGEFEHMVLLATLQLGETAYAPSISAELERTAGRSVSRGALYSALGRLEEKGFLRWQLETPGAERGGHAKRRFEVTKAGLAAVRTYRVALLRLWSNLEAVLGGEPG